MTEPPGTGGRGGNEGGKTIQSVETALSVLEYIREHGEVGVSEAATVLDCSKSTVHHHLTTLVERGYVEKVDGRYRLGLTFLALGGEVRERQRLYHLGKDDVDALADRTGEKARLIVEHDGRGITLYQSTGENVADTDTHTHVGSVEELHCTAAGKAFLAELSADELDAYLADAPLTAYTDATITDPDALREELEAIRSRGVAFDDEERYEGVRCVASAIDVGTGELLGALSVSGPTERIDDDRFRTDIPNRIQNVVGVVEINTTYSEWTDAF
ncbi:IclR family transcriptional regulator [Halopelagius longus]|uniref:IclR family transcriptional regulator n=1 Tax=Halopelagius longus TaxID=1236180 RepID=A0A1H1FSA7_9EURY|nr:IclR family transcriptional regulator [Halopelagius longus]RDI70188.1 IclR family transcriptional regulator [Halopelagius longus]SDR03760.1 transcriptional regulator, IclR family [Halopelagius longus]